MDEEVGRVYRGRFWGWDDESVFFVQEEDRENPDATNYRLQEYPDLMKQVLALCERYFERRLDEDVSDDQASFSDSPSYR